ncbi:hypothetical protein [Salinigranum marinum]|uniref:hypothetical protein n=1 Tax=Salinigranum marinum TaxID=1515595 RepID=UPI002989D397|nr:hypothetical protein [Salinigranum marinum]
MTQTREALDLAIETTAESFMRNPANYSDERALAEDVRRRVCSVMTPASVGTVIVEESSRASGDIPDHEAYTARYRDVTEIDRVQCEVGGVDFPFGGRERLDLGVFADGLRITVIGGTQEFAPTDLIGAAEFKYVKNTNYLRYRTDDDASKYRDIADDIERLGELPDGIDRRCVVFANYNLLRRESDAEAERKLRELAEECGVGLRLVLPATRSSWSESDVS